MTPSESHLKALWALFAFFIVLLACVIAPIPASPQGLTNSCINNVSAQGTPDAITSAALPCGTTTNFVILTAHAANVTTTPTYQPLGSPALPIIRANGSAVAIGDFTPGYVALLSSTGSSWVLFNPATINGISPLGPGVAMALTQAVTGTGGIVLQTFPTIDGVTIVGPNSTAGGFNYTQTFTGALTTFFPNNFTCNVNGVTGSSANSLYCLSIANTGSSGANTAVPGGLAVTNTVTHASGNSDGDFFIAVGTLAEAQSDDGGSQTTLNGSFTTGATSITVASIAGMNNGDFIEIVLNNGYIQGTAIASTPSGHTVAISPGLYANANSGNTVYDPKGNFDGGIIQSQSGSTGHLPQYLSAVIGATATAYMYPGSATFLRRGLSVENDLAVPLGTDTGATVYGYDEMIAISAQAGVATLAKYGIIAADETGEFPLKSTGTFIKVGGIQAGASSGTPTLYTLNSALDFSTTAITNNFATWLGPTGLPFSITGAGFAYLANVEAMSPYPEFIFDDTHSSVTAGGLQRVVGDGSGNYYYEINTAVAGDFSTSTNVYEVTAAGKFNIIQGLQAGGVAGVTCSGTPTSSFASNVGIVTHC